MPRRPRIEYFGAMYHVIVRGNRKQNIFEDDADRLKYLELDPGPGSGLNC